MAAAYPHFKTDGVNCSCPETGIFVDWKSHIGSMAGTEIYEEWGAGLDCYIAVYWIVGTTLVISVWGRTPVWCSRTGLGGWPIGAFVSLGHTTVSTRRE